MNVSKNYIFVLGLAGLAVALANCSGGGVSITSPTPAPSASPSSLPTTSACLAPPPDPNETQVPIVSSSQPQTVNVPCYHDFTGVATIPANTTVAGPTVANISVTSDSGAFNILDDPAAGTRLLTTEIAVSGTVTLGNPSIATLVTSPTMIGAPHVYEAELYLAFNGANPFPQASLNQLNLTPNGHTIAFNVTNPAGDTFPAGTAAFVVIYQNH